MHIYIYMYIYHLFFYIFIYICIYGVPGSQKAPDTNKYKRDSEWEYKMVVDHWDTNLKTFQCYL